VALIEKHLAEQLVAYREQEALGTPQYVPIGEVIGALQHHLDREMELRATIARISAEITPITARLERVSGAT
jgi:hypothetical protein